MVIKHTAKAGRGWKVMGGDGGNFHEDGQGDLAERVMFRSEGGVTWAEQSRQRDSQCKGPGAETYQSISGEVSVIEPEKEEE